MTEQSQPDEILATPHSLTLPCKLSDVSGCLDWLRERYMKSTRDPLLLDAMTEVLKTDASGALTSEPQRLGLVKETRGVLDTGSTGDGKTALIRRNLQRPPGIGLTNGQGPDKALYLRFLPEATLQGVAIEIPEKTRYVLKENHRLRTMKLWRMAQRRLSMLSIKILWIDEAHHMLEKPKEVIQTLRRMKSLMQGDSGIVLIVSGIQVLDEKIRMDPETSGRFNRVKLGPLRSDQERRDLRQFVDLCCSFVKLAHVPDRHLIERLEFATHGSIGRSIEYSISAIGRALWRKDGQLTLDDYRRVFDLKRGFSDDGPFDDEEWPVLKDILDKKGWPA